MQHQKMHKVARLGDLPEDRGTRVKIADTPVMLVRTGDTVHAYAADCPHAGAPLEEGAICNGRIVCPWHKGTFDASDGSLVEPPALVGLTRYPASVDDGDVYVSPEPVRQQEDRRAPDPATMFIAGAGAAGAAACAALRPSTLTLQRVGQQSHERLELDIRRRVEIPVGSAVERPRGQSGLAVDQLGDGGVDGLRGDDAPGRDRLCLADAVDPIDGLSLFGVRP